MMNVQSYDDGDNDYDEDDKGGPPSVPLLLHKVIKM